MDQNCLLNRHTSVVSRDIAMSAHAYHQERGSLTHVCLKNDVDSINYTQTASLIVTEKNGSGLFDLDFYKE